jgi:hypothetical protein
MKPVTHQNGGSYGRVSVTSRHGAALIIVLVILVMLFLLPLAFFIQSGMQRQVANASTTLGIEGVLAEGAIERIMSDFEQEIAAGSTPQATVVTNLAAGTVSTNLVFYPTSSTTMVPALAGSSGANGLENLLKRSGFGITNYPGGTSLAIQSSTTNPSLNGFSVTLAKWNQHLLLARANPASSTDTTPINSFTPPDWIVVARDGSIPGAWSNGLCWSLTNTTTAIGRYAYAVYDEGGLLDANVAGYPPALTNQSALPVCGKGGEFFADLTQIGLDTNQINALVGWRNYATAAASGTFPAYSIPDSGVSYSLAVLGNNNGFMATANTNTLACANSSGIGTDHQFVSRQELISFLESCEPGNVVGAMNALRFLGNFSRCINQPSFAPASGRPSVLSMANGGNNVSAYGNDNAINPAFLGILVNSSSFVRNNGSTANVGDPLVKKRFPLSLLSWITYAGPSAVNTGTWAPYVAAGIPQSLLAIGSANNIQGYFGLTWNSNSASSSYGSWTYRSGSNQPIMTLSQVAAVGRDPDFFELLKAAITVGSLGKAYTYTGAASNTTAWITPAGYNEVYDNWTDAQIIQIGANIIGQSRPDSYPTRIQFCDGSTFGGATVEIRSTQDLPYLYRVREGKIMVQDSSPSVRALPTLTNSWSAANSGSGIVLQEPEIWNPHAMRTNALSNPGPTKFRLLAITGDPISLSTNGNVPTASYTIGESWIPYSGAALTWQNSSSTNLNANNACLSFTIPANRQDLFREPTLLIKPGIPNGSALSASSTFSLASTLSAYQYAAIGVSDSGQYIGIPMGTVPMAYAATFMQSGIASGVPAANSGTPGIAPAGYVTYQTNGTAGTPSVTYLLQCQDYFGNWVTYDEKYASVANSTNAYSPSNTGTNTNSTIFEYNQNKTFYTDSNNTNWSKNAIGSEWSVVAFDPRTSRFGMIVAGCGGDTNTTVPLYSFPLGSALGSYAASPLYTAGWSVPIGTATNATAIQYAAQQNALLTIRPDEYSGMLLATNTIPSAAGWYPSGSVSRPGMLAQNNPNISGTSTKRFSTDPQTASFSNQYYADPDGVVRRGMAAYVPSGNLIPATVPGSGYPSGIPFLPAYSFGSTGVETPLGSGSANANEYLSRPVILNRPFRSVAELGYAFSGTPWRNLDCSTPESGGAALLDVFCVNDTTDSLGLVAGRVNLNTRQLPVLQAILSGAYKEEFNPTNGIVNSLMSTNLANSVAQALITRTQETAAPAGPLVNISDLVGKWYSGTTISGVSAMNGSISYAGFSDDSTGVFGAASNDLTSVLGNPALATDPEQRIQRLRDASIRALSSAGQTRVWNLMIDLVVQAGRYPTTATGFNAFVVDGQIHYWVHLAIDRLTGQVLDRRVETVKQ